MKIFTSIKNKEATMLGSFKNCTGVVSRVLLTLTLALAFFAGDALAQCSGKVISIKFPAEWGATTYVYLGGNFTRITGTKDGDWTKFTLPTLTNDNATATIVIADYNDHYNQNGTTHAISKTLYTSDKQLPSTGLLTCADFGANGTWIMENPSNPGRTFISTTPPDAYYLYFLPPGDDEWVLGQPYLVYKNANGVKEKLKLTLDFDKCGWYRAMWFNNNPPLPTGDAWIYLDDGENFNRLGKYGFDEDPLEWPDGPEGDPTPFNLPEQFGNAPGDLVFTPSQPSHWGTSVPSGLNGVCSYEFAAFIYDTDASVNSSFFDFDGTSSTSATGRSPKDGSGILKGMVQETLDANGKIQWKGTSTSTTSFNGANDGWTQQNFTDAFKSTPGKNVPRCYDMPFKRSRAGLWEFDSNKLCSDGSIDLDGTCGATSRKFLGGFFPPELQSTAGGDYSGCAACGQHRPAQGWVDFKDTMINNRATPVVSKWCYDRGYLGPASVTGLDAAGNPLPSSQAATRCTRAFGNGDFRNGDNPANFWNWEGACGNGLTLGRDGRVNGVTSGTTPCAANTGPVGASGTITISGDGWENKTMNKNQLFCFESAPAQFTYEPGQEFFFSGDDDIWVFIDKKLVIDLGGTHLAAPGYVSLDNITPKLEVGKKYDINIFFCDRRTTMSNVRITTNMYFSQKSGLNLKEGTAQIETDICMESSGGGSCSAESSGPSEKCGPELAANLQYYMTRRDGFTDRTPVNANTPGCSQSGDMLNCFGSVEINLKTGKVKVGPQAQGIVGTWVIWAETVNIEPKPKDLRLGATSGRTVIQVAWGKIVGDGKDIITIPHDGVDGKRGKQAVASKLVPVAFAEGAWTKDSSGTDATFEVDMESSPGKVVSIQPSSKSDADVPGSYLKIYRDPEGLQEVTNESSFTIPSDGPNKGVLVLYFTGEYEAARTATYSINSRSTGDPFVFKVHQPKIEFVNANNEIIPQGQRFGSDPSKGNNARERMVYVGTTINRRIAAFDPVDGGICQTCTFTSAGVNTEQFINNARVRDVIQFTEKSLKEGLGSLSLYGNQRVQPENDSSASLTVRGPSEDPSTVARWDSLLFREPPVPYPVNAEIFDRNGDGIADSIRIVYNREFPGDTLPNMIQIVWSVTDTVSFGKATKGADGKYTDAGISAAENMAFWAPYLKRGVNPKDGDTIVITVPYGDREDIQPQLSGGKIKTANRGVGETVISWSTYIDDEGNAGVTSSFNTGITDKIPPIVTSAEYTPGEGDCGTEAGRPCIDYVRIWLSEPVERSDGATDDKAKEAFAYKLLIRGEDATFDRYTEGKSLPTEMLWSKNDRWLPKGDSIVRLTYRRFKTETDNSYTPVPGDSVRLLDKRGSNPLEHAFKDLEGNSPNPEEWGRKIEGRGPWSVDKNLITSVDPADSTVLKDRIRDRFGSVLGDTIVKRFTKEKPIQLVPVPESWKGDNLKDSLTYNYPSTVGPIFWPGARATVDELDTRLGRQIDRNKIWFVANSFYHTNLGNYTAKSGEIRIKCTDAIFQIGGAKDCTESENGLYLGWDLKDNKGRWVGTGAYVQVYNFYWEVKDVDPKVNGTVKKYPDDGNKIEMYGVKRASSGKKK